MTDNDKQLVEALERALPWLNKALAENINKDCAMANDLPQTIELIKAALLQVRFYSQPDFMGSLNVAKKEYWK
jgi:hypothetical protein